MKKMKAKRGCGLLPWLVAAVSVLMFRPGAVFAAVLGYNPIDRLLPQASRSSLPKGVAARVTGGRFFAQLLAAPLAAAMHLAFLVGALLAFAGVCASLLRGPRVREPSPGTPTDTADLTAVPA